MRSRPKKKTKKGPTDSDIEKTYTGLDRELAEEFIESTMADPAVMERTVMSGTESEAWWIIKTIFDRSLKIENKILSAHKKYLNTMFENH